MLAIFGLSFLLLATTAAVDPEQSSVVGDLGYKLLETRFDQLELKLQSTLDQIRSEQRSLLSNTNSLLEKIVSSLNVIQQQNSQIVVISSCDEATTTGRYRLQLPNHSGPITVICDMDVFDGRWLVIQQRLDGSVSFNRRWAVYRERFGVVAQSRDFWLGLETIHKLTQNGDHEILIQLRDESGNFGYARYGRFQVAGEDKNYKLSSLGEYDGNIGNQFYLNLGSKFSTYDSDNDKWSDGNCAQSYGCGWWFDNCSSAILNSPYVKDSNIGGIYWADWTKAATYSRMLIRQSQIQDSQRIIESCEDATATGVYQLTYNEYALKPAFCAMEVFNGGWLVIQQRLDGSIDFNRSWAEYRDGFGVVGQFSEFWLGLETIYQLTKGGDHELLVELRNETGHYFSARYERFQIAGEDQRYRLFPVAQSGGPVEYALNESRDEVFATYDRDIEQCQDENCAQKFAGGWWYYNGKHTTLNGPFKKDSNTGRGIFWREWTRAATYCRMLIRRK